MNEHITFGTSLLERKVKNGWRYWLSMLFCMFSFSAYSQLRINEVLASNASVNVDPVDSAYSDWVEIYNFSGNDINLNGYYVTDDLTKPTKWQINVDTIIPSKGYILLWCDNNAKGLHTNFKLSADGEQVGIYSPQKQILDTLTFAAQFVNVSYGRMLQDSSKMRFFLLPTPAAANTTQAYTGYANQPEIMTLGGFYSGPVKVEITQDLGGKVHYTLDGSEPDSTSAVYTSPLDITATTVLRARIIDDGLMPGKIITESYFINEGFDKHQLPVVSIATTPANFWDSKKGIYVQSYKPDWEVPVNIEMFENNGSDRSAFNGLAGIKINGLYSWQLPQKMLGVYFKKEYGDGKLSHQLFFDCKRTTFDNFSLRASGNDWSNTLFRDGLLQQACRHGNTNLELMAFRPSVVYVNGTFLGIHNIREKVDDDYISSNIGIKKGTFDMIEGGDYVETGDMAAWDSLQVITAKDLSQQSNFDELASVFDVENMTDYIAAELYCGNTSIDHHTMAWKPKGSGKWRWVLMDADRGFFSYGSDMLSFYTAKTVWPLAKMMKNSSYKTYLCRRIANQLFTTFNPLTIGQQIDRHQKDIEAVMPQQVTRWLGTTSSYGNAMPSVSYWYDEVENRRTCTTVRAIVLLQELTSYGCSAPALLSLTSSPDSACTWTFNQMKAGQSTWYAPYPMNMPVTLTADKKAGYDFKGWRENKLESVITKGSTWKYLDTGTDQGTAWQASDFDDSSWKSGLAPLGYAVTGVKTTVSYGSSSSSKYITTYFRKKFTVSTPSSQLISLKMNLLREDGAIVYLNGKKLLSTNMPLSDVNYKSTALYACGGLAETSYITFDVPLSYLQEGENTFAVEVHQAAASSTDMAFDLQLQAEERVDTAGYFSTSPTCEFALTADRSITAVFESNGQSIVPDSINTDMVFYKSRSPYIVPNDVYIQSGAKLTIEPGVQVWMAPDTKFLVHGSIIANGLPADSILFRLNPAYSADNSWGALCFINASDTSRMSYLELRNASQGPLAYNCVAAISSFHSALRLDHLNITDVNSNPVAARYSDIKVTNSRFHSEVTGDLVNVKYGKGVVINNRFIGNKCVDTDGIDFDGVSNGLIQNNVISNFAGSNSDAIDLGERTKEARIVSNFAYNITDKGVSVGQRSSPHVSNCNFIKTTSGVSVKDSSRVSIDSCTFFNVGTPVACYEKVFGRAGGNAVIRQSILSNSVEKSILCDGKSQVYISKSISDNDTLPAGQGNLYGEPGFLAPGKYDLRLKTPFTPSKGSDYMPETPSPDLTIVEIGYNTTGLTGGTEYIRLYNPDDNNSIDVSGYTLSHAVDFTFPQGISVSPLGSVYLAKDASALYLKDTEAQSFTWTSGSLANEGEAITVSDANGFVVDQVAYSPNAPWPSILVNGEMKALSLTDYIADNHLAKNWSVMSYPTDVKSVLHDNRYLTNDNGRGTVHFADGALHQVDVYTLTGQKVRSLLMKDGQTADLTTTGQPVLLISTCGMTEKMQVGK